MLPSPSSSPRVALINRTNVDESDTLDSRAKSHWLQLLTPPRTVKRLSKGNDGRAKKRAKIALDSGEESEESSDEEESDSDVEMEDLAMLRAKARRGTVPGMLAASLGSGPSRSRQPLCMCQFHASVQSLTRCIVSTRPFLQTFVSSNKSDIFKCQSEDSNAYLSPPYACAYTHSKFFIP